jgi:hypothetical protein
MPMPEQNEEQSTGEKAAVTLPGVVEKIIKPVIPTDPEKAQISVEGADHLYREIRVENKLTDADGKEVALKPGAEVDVTIEAEPHHTKPVARDAAKAVDSDDHNRKATN